MKHYSGRQLVYTAAVTFAITFSIAILFLFMGDDDVIPSISDEQLAEMDFNSSGVDETSYSGKSPLAAMEASNTLTGFTEDERNNISIYTKLNSAVVNITTEVLAYNWFLEPVPREGGSGSGSIIDSKGIILTNTHVVENAYKVYVNLSDGTQFEGEVLGKDPENDLAVVRINPEGKLLQTIPLGTSSNLMIGQKVLAIGNPFGYDRTLTTGIVSGLARPVRSSKNLVIQNMIQTDASINPGNSGGPLMNSSGEMIGINTMIYSPSGGSVGIGFAVPVDTARRVIPDLIQFGEVKRGWLDLTPIQLNASIVKYAALGIDRGILVSRVTPNGLADRAGIRGGTEAVRYGRSIIYLGGDVIVEVDGQEIAGYTDLFSALEDNKPGDRVSVTLIRDGNEVKVTVGLIERPANLLQDS